MKELTKAEEQIMHVLWKQGKTTVKEILDELPEPKPAINTVSTIVRILEKKEFVDHEPFGRGYKYFPIIDKKAYTRRFLKTVVGSYFGNSFKDMVSFFAKENRMDLKDFEEMMNEIKDDLKEDKSLDK